MGASVAHPAIPRLQGGWPEGLFVRRCVTSDVDGIWALFDEPSYRRSGTVLDPFASASDVSAWLEAQQDGNLLIVGLVADTIVAFAGLYVLRGRQNHVGAISLGVRERFRGRGIGRCLLTLILAAADQAAALRRVQLHVFADNDRAIALYRGFGFEIEGRHADFARHDGTYIDAFTMARLTRSAARACPANVDTGFASGNALEMI